MTSWAPTSGTTVTGPGPPFPDHPGDWERGTTLGVAMAGLGRGGEDNGSVSGQVQSPGAI